jgi:hypothetical protein
MNLVGGVNCENCNSKTHPTSDCPEKCKEYIIELSVYCSEGEEEGSCGKHAWRRLSSVLDGVKELEAVERES